MLRDIFKVPKEKTGETLYKEDLISHVTTEFTKRQLDRLPYELQWKLNINFLMDNQYLEVNPHTQSIEEVMKIYHWQEREVYNQIAPIIETRLAKLARLSPVPKTRPATRERGDLASAKVSNKILESTYNTEIMARKQVQANNWSETTGTAIWKNVWNPDKGRVIGVDEETGEEIREGDVEAIVVSPFEIYPDSPFSTLEQCRSIIHAKTYHVDEVELLWGVKEEGSEVNVFTLKEQGVAMGGLGHRNSAYAVTSQKKEDQVIVYEYNERPSKAHPEGRLIICTDNELLHAGPLPYEIGPNGTLDFPFDVQHSISGVNMFFGKSVIERLLPLQRKYNDLKNRINEYMNRFAIGQITYEQGTIDEDFLEEEGLAPGAMIPYARGGRPPTYMTYNTLPSAFREEEQALNHLFVIISGVSEISRDSSAPTGVNSGVALAILQEQDDTRLALTAQHLNNTKVNIAKKWLRLYQQFADGPRIIKFVGKDNEVDVIDWTANDLTTDDVYIETSTLLAESPAQRRQMVFDLLSAGLFNDPETGMLSNLGRRKVFEMLEMGNWEQADNSTNLQQQRALRENRAMQEGAMADVKSFDDHIIHIEVHNSFRLTAEFEEIVAEMPEIEQVYEEHINVHLQALQEMAMQQQPPMEEEPGIEAPEEQMEYSEEPPPI